MMKPTIFCMNRDKLRRLFCGIQKSNACRSDGTLAEQIRQQLQQLLQYRTGISIHHKK